jgi:membrane protein
MALSQLTRFFAHDIWQRDVDSLSGRRGTLLKLGRLFALATRGFWKDEGLHRASALAFDTVLGLLPAMALVVSVMKGFGVYGPFVHDTLKPGLNDLFASMGDHLDSGNVTLRAAFFKLLDLVEATEFGTLGWVGLVFVLYIVVLMLFSIEQSLNHVFGVERARSLARKFADFSAVLLITPLCGMVAATVATHARNFEWAGHGLVLRLLAVVAMGVGLTLAYTIMPFTRVRLRSGLLGGFVAGLLWFVVLSFHVRFQIGVARYNALYSTFAAIPIFFVWVFISWLVVLFGAELAAADNNIGAFRWRVRGGDAGSWARSYVALRSLVEIGDAFERRLSPRMLQELSAAVGAPDGLIKDVLDPLVEAGMLAQVQLGQAVAYVLAGDPDRLTIEEVLTVVECKDQKEGLDRVVDADERVESILNRLWDARAAHAGRITVRSLVTQVQSLPPPSRRSAQLTPTAAQPQE